MNETQTIEINGTKFEIDMRHAKRIDTLVVGSKVKLLRCKTDYKAQEVFSGVVVGFEPFDSLPTIIVAYLEIDYSGVKLLFAYLNADTREKWELIASIDDELPVQKADVLHRFETEIAKKREEIADIERKRDYFLRHFNRYFEPAAA